MFHISRPRTTNFIYLFETILFRILSNFLRLHLGSFRDVSSNSIFFVGVGLKRDSKWVIQPSEFYWKFVLKKNCKSRRQIGIAKLNSLAQPSLANFRKILLENNFGKNTEKIWDTLILRKLKENFGNII